MARDPERILIVRMSAAGDIIICLCVLHAVRAAFPRAHITWLVDERFAELVEHQPELDQVLAAPMRRWHEMLKSPRQWLQLRREARAFGAKLRADGAYDVCLDLHGILKSTAVARWAKCRRNLVSSRAHLRKLRPFVRREWIPSVGVHYSGRILPVAAAIGADVSHPSFAFYVPEEAQAYADRMLAEHDFAASGPLVALNPGASAPLRRWPGERLAAVARRLKEEVDARVVVIGGPGEEELAQSIVEQADVGALCTAGRTRWEQLGGLLKRCRVVVTADTGPMHLAAAVGARVLGLFGPSLPERTGPSEPGHLIIQKDIPCRPCLDHPTCDDYHCLTAIEVEDVVAGVLGLLEAGGGPRE